MTEKPKPNIHLDIGDLKALAVRAANARGMKLVDWIKEAIQEKLEKENETLG